MEGRPPPLDPLRLPQSVPPFRLHAAAGLLSASATAAAHAFPYLSSLTSGGGNGLGALGGSPFRTPHSVAAMRQFWPPTPPPDSYSRYGGSYYSLFPSVGPLASPPDPYSGHQALFSRLSHAASPYSPVLDLHRDPNFLSPGLNLTSPLTPTNLSNHVSPISPLATSSLLSPPMAPSAAVTPSVGSVDSLAAQGEKHHHSDGLLTTVHLPNGTSKKAGLKTTTSTVATKERRPEKCRPKKSSQKAKDLTGSKVKETKAESGHCMKCSWGPHTTELPPWPAPPTSVTTKVTAITAPVITTTVSPCQNSETLGGVSRTSLTFCSSLCIPSDQVSSTVPSPSHPPLLLSPSGQPVVSSSTSDAESISHTPDIFTTPLPDSSKPASPVMQTTESPVKRPVMTAQPRRQDEKEKPVDLSDPCIAPTDLSLSPCSSTTTEEKRTVVVSVSPIVAKVTLPTERTDAAKIVDLSKEASKAEQEARPTCQYAGQGALTKQEPVDFRCEPMASCAVKPQVASTYMPLSKAAVMLSVQQTKVVSSTRVRGVKNGGVAVGVTKAAATSRAVISSPLTHVSPKVQEVAPVNLKVTKPLVREPATPPACVQRSIEGTTPRLAVAPEARKIVVEEKCDTTVSVVPALSVLNAANQPIPVGIAVAQQRQDHTITCSKTSMSSSSSEQGQITAVSCSTVILTTENSDKTSCISEQKHSLQPHPAGLAEATTACLVTAGPSSSHSPWEQQTTDALSLRPPTTTLRWLAASPVANTSPSVMTPTLWLGQNAAPLDPTPSSAFPLTSPGGFQLARDAVTGQLYLVPAASWTLASPAAPMQQILTQQHTTFQQIMPETWSADVMKAAEVVPKLEVAETKDATLAAFSTLGTTPQQPVMSYVYDASPVVQPLVATHAATLAPVIPPPTKVSQGTSPQISFTPSPPPQQVVVEQGVQASDTDGAVDESDDDYARGDPTHVTKVANRVMSVTTAVQVDMDSQTASEDNETDDGAPCFVRTTFDCANQTDDLPLQKEVPSSCDETTCDEEYRDSTQQPAPVASVASGSNRSSEIHFTSDSEIDDSIPVLTTQSSGVREFIDHHGLDLLVDSIEEFAASQECETERMPQLSKSASETGSPIASPSESPRNDGPPNLSSASPSSRPGEFSAYSSPSSPKLVLASPEYYSTDLEGSPQHCATKAQQVHATDKQQVFSRQQTKQCPVNTEDSLKLRFVHESAGGAVSTQKAKSYSVVSSETNLCQSLQSQSKPTKRQRVENPSEPGEHTPQQSLSLFWTTNRKNWQGAKYEQSPDNGHDGEAATVAELPQSYDGSCTDGLGLLCALAEQRFLEESRKEQQRPAEERQPQLEEDAGLECQVSAEAMDPEEREMRKQLAELQRKFREKQQELANFQPRKERELDLEEKLHAHKTKEEARHKKRRHSIAAMKVAECTSPDASGAESPKVDERVPDLHSADDAFSALLRTPDQRQKSQISTNNPVHVTSESRESEKPKEECRQQCVPVLTIKLSPEQYHDEASKSEVTEPECAGDTKPVVKKRKRKISAREKLSPAHSHKNNSRKEELKSPSPEPSAEKKNLRSKEARRSKSFSEGDFWCVRRSERIFLLDAGVVSSSSLSISDNPDKAVASSRSRSSGTTKSQARTPRTPSHPTKLSAKRQQSSSPCAKSVVKQKRSCKPELVSVLKKCRHSEEARKEKYDDSDSDSTENVPLSRLSSRERPTVADGVQEQQCYLEPSDLHDLTRVVMLEDGLLYAGYINEIQAPDVYGITLDGERGNRPHIFSQEEMLKEAVREVKPRSLRELPEGRRVCAYWSQQYRCLYPGAVAKATSPDPSPDNTLVYVEFDDGDSGKIPLEDVRLLPQDFPPTDEQHARGKRVRKPFALKAGKDAHPSLVLNKKRRRASQDGQEELKDNESRSKKIKKHKKSKMKKTKTKNTPSSGHDSDDSDVFGGEEKWMGSGAAKKRRKEHKHKHHHKHHRCHHRRKHRHRKHQDAEKGCDSESPKHSSDTIKASSANLSSSSEQTSGCSANCSPSAVEETRDCKHPELTVRIRTSSTEMQQIDSDAGGESSADASEDSSSSSSDEEAEERGMSVAAVAEQAEARKPAKRKERLPSVEKSKIAAFLPERQLWRWSGKSFRRPGSKGKAKKEFYKAICRGKETITVGDCAVFLSTGRPNLPYIGRIETMWQSWGGNMIVRVKWFYHPDETKGLARLIQPKGALFQSPHADENDVQTISHKCEVLSWDDYRALCQSEAADGTSDVYYLAGSYDPYSNTICIEPQVKKP